MSICALEPPVLTTETTCVAAPTEFANHGLPAAPLTGASTKAAPTKDNPAHSRANSRRIVLWSTRVRLGSSKALDPVGSPRRDQRSLRPEYPQAQQKNRDIPAPSRRSHRTGDARST